MGGHRSRTAAASFRPSMEPGMSMSVKTRKCRGGFRAWKLLISIHRDNYCKSRIFQLLSDHVPDYRFVFNNQDCSHFHFSGGTSRPQLLPLIRQTYNRSFPVTT
jgi:hypothetical protein